MRRSKEEIAAEKKLKAERAAERQARAAARRAEVERKREAREAKAAAAHAARQASAARIKASLAPVEPKRARDMTPAERALLRIDKIEKQKAKELKLAGIEYDPRTAAGQREYDVRSLGGSKGARVDRYNTLFRNRGEATKVRILACEEFDKLCHIAAGGLYPEQKFEPRVDTSGIGGMADDRAAGLQTMEHLRARIGDDFHALMMARVHMSMTYVAMERAGYGDRNVLAGMFVMAVDAVARFYKIGGPSPLVRAANAAFDIV